MKPTVSLPSQVTLRDIAQNLKVSVTTVSMALRNHPKISVVRRQQVHQIAHSMGYIPNHMAVALAQKRYDAMPHPIGGEIAWINCWEPPQDLRNFREFDLYWRGAQLAAQSHGFRLEEFIVGAKMSFSRLEKILQSRNIQGILVPPQSRKSLSWPDVSHSNWNKYSIVRFGYSVPIPLHAVASNHIQGVMLAFTHILNKGYTRIGYVCPIDSYIRARAGYLMFQTHLPPADCLPLLVLTPHHPMKERLQLLKNWIQKSKPEAILTELGEMSWMLRELDYQVPGDIGLATTSVLDGNADAGLNQNSEEIGKVAIQTLLSLMHHNLTGLPHLAREVLVNASWQDGKSLPGRSTNREVISLGQQAQPR